MNESVLDRLDLPSIASSDALLVFWLTNRKGIEEEMEERLENWDMEVIGHWKWLKVTMEGVPVGEFDNEKHKVPFESLILARRKGKKEGKSQLPAKFVFARLENEIQNKINKKIWKIIFFRNNSLKKTFIVKNFFFSFKFQI